MAGWRKPTKEETSQRRAAVATKARSGDLRFPEAVVEMRHAIGFTQTEFAKLFKLTTRQIAEIERGEANPTAQTINKIAGAFGLQIGLVPIEQPKPLKFDSDGD
jgi:transcriptional regulator with XRE-family HTH domain